ncbi:Fur family transcriptional regulator [Shuttleworthella satelles]|uniref:Transcriptional regulator, Fur family n=1 Tax=Shuttleworthella satelles DSM 14600 TaxID=626523 RepID=C4GC37_9FIRM|nr:transcriptional repressor [Shuttleworthia satelles]EEP27979.1 transcriptional regulator, Fur family [Shuttleworthia satelles DSM 14600]
MALRYSRQRELIARNLKNRSDHPSADMVYASVREQMPHISLGTVYRNLKDMTACGEAISFMVDGKEHFDGRNTPHIHLCCSRCGSIVERLVVPEELQLLAGDSFKVENVILQGICESCRQKKVEDREKVENAG